MVQFVGLLLGLLVGSIEIELAVDSTVARVVVELDGAVAAELTGPPWRTAIPLGSELRPHRLTALALDARGLELDRATRLVNVYRPPAGVDYVLHRNSKGWVTMLSLAWESRAGAPPQRSAVAIDGTGVAFEDAQRIFLPPLDPHRLHVIEAVAEYGDGLVARDRIGVGGPVLGAGSARLTAVAATIGAGARPPGLGRIAARLAADGRPVRVIGVERGDADVVFVRDAEAGRAVERIAPARGGMGALSGARDAQAARLLHSIPFADDEWVRILDPEAVARAAGGLDPHRLTYPLVSDHPGGFGLFWQLKNADPEAPSPSRLPLADAVALAGCRAAAGARRRAAVLLLAPDSADGGSRLDPAQARDYLEALGVPLRVWYLGKAAKAPPGWGPVVGVRSLSGMEEAMDGVRAVLGEQGIVWVEGTHLPGEVEVVLDPVPAGGAG